MPTLSISFEGYWLCRLATDPDPSVEQRGVSGFTFAVAGETLLEPSIWSQEEDVKNAYGLKDPEFIDPLASYSRFNIKNIREASPDRADYNSRGIGIRVSKVEIDGFQNADLEAKLMNAPCRFVILSTAILKSAALRLAPLKSVSSRSE